MKPRYEASLLFFWGVGCPHCDEAKPFVDELARELPDLTIERIEVRKDADGRKRFLDVVRELGIAAPGIPMFVYGKRYQIGSLRDDVGTVVRYGYLALYNLAYIVPLGLIAVAYSVTLHRLHLSDRGAKILKLVSGVLLVAFGLLFLVAPDALI